MNVTSQRAKRRQGCRVLTNLNKHGRDSPYSLDRALPNCVVEPGTAFERRSQGEQTVPGSARRCLKQTRFVNLRLLHDPFRPPADITLIKPAVLPPVYTALVAPR